MQIVSNLFFANCLKIYMSRITLVMHNSRNSLFTVKTPKNSFMRWLEHLKYPLLVYISGDSRSQKIIIKKTSKNIGIKGSKVSKFNIKSQLIDLVYINYYLASWSTAKTINLRKCEFVKKMYRLSHEKQRKLSRKIFVNSCWSEDQ